MPNIYTSENREKNIYFVEHSGKNKNIKRTISQNVTSICVESLSKGVNEFVVAVTKSIMQEK